MKKLCNKSFFIQLNLLIDKFMLEILKLLLVKRTHSLMAQLIILLQNYIKSVVAAII